MLIDLGRVEEDAVLTSVETTLLDRDVEFSDLGDHSGGGRLVLLVVAVVLTPLSVFGVEVWAGDFEVGVEESVVAEEGEAVRVSGRLGVEERL